MIKAKYTQGDNSQEFEFNSMGELLEYERKTGKGAVSIPLDCSDGMIFKSNVSWADCDEQRKRYENATTKSKATTKINITQADIDAYGEALLKMFQNSK